KHHGVQGRQPPQYRLFAGPGPGTERTAHRLSAAAGPNWLTLNAANENSVLSPRMPTAPAARIGAQPVPRSVIPTMKWPLMSMVMRTAPFARSVAVAPT